MGQSLDTLDFTQMTRKKPYINTSNDLITSRLHWDTFTRSYLNFYRNYFCQSKESSKKLIFHPLKPSN